MKKGFLKIKRSISILYSTPVGLALKPHGGFFEIKGGEGMPPGKKKCACRDQPFPRGTPNSRISQCKDPCQVKVFHIHPGGSRNLWRPREER